MRYDKGPLGAIIDEYERTADEFIRVISAIDPSVYAVILDPESPDKECRSIQGICWHVLLAGYAYANAIRTKFALAVSTPDRSYPTHAEFPSRIHTMLSFTDESLSGLYEMKDDELTATNIPVRWSDHHDLEALMEHAVVHVLRHRRQVERLLNSMP